MEDHEKQCLATLKRLKRGNENALETKLGHEKVVASEQLRMAVETEKRARLENDAATKRFSLAMETDEERKARLEKMIAASNQLIFVLCMIKVTVRYVLVVCEVCYNF